MRFLLRQRGYKGQAHLAVTIQCVDIFSLEEYAHGMWKRSQMSDFSDAVQDIARETADTLCDDEVDQARLAVFDHLLEFITVAERGAADSFIRVYTDKFPAGVPGDILFVITLLQFVG